MTAPSLAGVVAVLGGDLWDGGRRANVPAPGHSVTDRSVSLLLSGDRVIVHSFGSADWREVRAALAARGLVDVSGRLCSAARAQATASDAVVLTAAARLRAAQQLWSEGQGLAGTLAARHLALRRVRPPGQGLRFHRSVAAAVYVGCGRRRPALLAAVQDVEGRLCAVELTYLAPDGARAALRVPRKTIGLLPRGCAVRLAPAAPEMVVAEGVFTALSAAERFGAPAWALLSAGNLAAWAPPADVGAVLVAADRDAAGKQAARRLAARLASAGLRVEVRWPPAPHGDWNDAA